MDIHRSRPVAAVAETSGMPVESLVGLPTVSVVVPIHNAEKFIDQTLLALLKSPVEGLELVLIFDNCNDGSLSVARDCLEQHGFENVQLVEAANGSTALSRNQGIELATGDFVAFVDHDDLVDATMYTRMQRFAASGPVDVVRCGFTILHEDKPEEVVERLPDRKSYPFRGIFIWNGMFRRSFLNANGIRFHPGYGEDYEFNLALLAAGAVEGRLEEKSAYYHWRQHGSNLHKSRTAADFIARIESILLHHGPYLEQDGATVSHLVRWVADYIAHLATSGHLEDVAYAYTSSPAVRDLMTGSRMVLVDSAFQRRLLKAADAKAFQLIVEERHAERKSVRQAPSLGRFGAGLNFVAAQSRRVRTVHRNTGGTLPFLRYAFGRLRHTQHTTSAEMEIVSDRLAFLDSYDGPMAIFYVFRQQFISGGLISIYSIAAQLRRRGIEPVLVSDPGRGHVARNRLFPNEEVSIPWDEFLARRWKNARFFMVPEVKLAEFCELAKEHDLRFPGATLNILNQNNVLMPDIAIVDELRPRFADVTMTTAHLKYTSQETAQRWNVPVKHLSTYLSYKDYARQPLHEKRDLILYSMDPHPLKARIIESVKEAFPKYAHQVVVGLNYDDYRTLVSCAKFVVSFGEGLDNYFIEPFFCGGIGFTVYNQEFMPASFLKFSNVFSSFSEMERSLPSVMERLTEDPSEYGDVWRENFEILSELYDGATYEGKLNEYLAGQRDFVPDSRDHD